MKCDADKYPHHSIAVTFPCLRRDDKEKMGYGDFVGLITGDLLGFSVLKTS